MILCAEFPLDTYSLLFVELILIQSEFGIARCNCEVVSFYFNCLSANYLQIT